MTWLDFELSKKKILEFIDTVNKLRYKSSNKKKINSLDFLDNYDIIKNFDQFDFDILPPNQNKIFHQEKVKQKKVTSQKKKINSDLLSLIDENFNKLKKNNIFISYKKVS